MSCFHFTWLLRFFFFFFFFPNCDLAQIVTGLSILFCSAAEIEINSGPLYQGDFRQLPVTNKPFHSFRSHLYSCHHCPSIQLKFATTRGPKSQICFLSIFFFVVVVRNYMVQVLNLEQGPSPPVKWVCHGWRRRMCSCVNEPPSPFRGRDLHPSLFRDAAHAVSCPLLFFHSYPLWIFSLFPKAALP